MGIVGRVCARARYGGGGRDENSQAALVYGMRRDRAAADRRLAYVVNEVGPGRCANATREPRITTGLAADAYYLRPPHFGATAWTALTAV